ncbi:thiosulfate oxidation carrier complex protein SoxZ [Aquabacterium sp. A7-Y]|uniref:thiosulfate oxidation carrier complex protein SoxZ n=1 Tax=Aquabacterium sp. A7-Y TaxID=1349605 RepID=UPI00223DE221|nr:thiosulfate oxidation carrier complex protein SoxZ [Aquabacterium sp. A7-Y]MCW7540368.1 thiosulfate oxidation carrier complex protein SoxZ [Aquabacterium sp. A7-Y]
MSEATRIRAQLQGDKTTVRVLMAHEMESGQRKDAAGKPVPAWFIQDVTVQHSGRTVLAAQWGPAVSKNPYLQFSFRGGKVGDKIAVTWVDNRGERRSDEAAIA